MLRNFISWGSTTWNMDNRMETFLKYFLIVYYALFFTFAMLFPTYRVWKATSLNPYKLGNSDSAHDYIGKNFRIGIDEGVKTDLVQGGLFKISRNPIFLGMRLRLLGVFLILPNALMLAVLIAGETLVQTQVRLEEEFLTRAYGKSYLSYKKQVHRWI